MPVLDLPCSSLLLPLLLHPFYIFILFKTFSPLNHLFPLKHFCIYLLFCIIFSSKMIFSFICDSSWSFVTLSELLSTSFCGVTGNMGCGWGCPYLLVLWGHEDTCNQVTLEMMSEFLPVLVLYFI